MTSANSQETLADEDPAAPERTPASSNQDDDADPLTELFCGNTPKFWGVVNQPDRQPQNQRFHGGDS
jgi:hypothetical protein